MELHRLFDRKGHYRTAIILEVQQTISAATTKGLNHIFKHKPSEKSPVRIDR